MFVNRRDPSSIWHWLRLMLTCPTLGPYLMKCGFTSRSWDEHKDVLFRWFHAPWEFDSLLPLLFRKTHCHLLFFTLLLCEFRMLWHHFNRQINAVNCDRVYFVDWTNSCDKEMAKMNSELLCYYLCCFFGGCVFGTSSSTLASAQKRARTKNTR